MPADDHDKTQAAKKEPEIMGETPDSELKIEPRWMVLEATENYTKPLRTSLTIENQDDYPVAFCVRTKERHMPRLNQGYGVLGTRESITLDVIIPPHAEWVRSEENVIAKHHKLVFENLRLPTTVVLPTDPKERADMGRGVFRTTQGSCPFLRLYTKSHLVLLPCKS